MVSPFFIILNFPCALLLNIQLFRIKFQPEKHKFSYNFVNSIINHNQTNNCIIMKRTRILMLFLGTLLCSIQLFAQQITIQGTVYDPSGVTLPGASIFIKGNNSVGTVTDFDGQFTLPVQKGDVLVASFIGFNDIEYIVTDNPIIKIRFDQSSVILDETVVVGYGVQKKSVMSSSVSRVTSDDLDLGNPTTVQNALQGKVSGVSIISNSGQPGSDAKIRIRGVGTTYDSEPLYIIDGMPSENGINHLNPSDIESIEILKDAASAAIYGSRGANGVVLVTTKEGKAGVATVNYEFTYGIQNPAHEVELLNSEEYQMLMNEMAKNSGKDPFFTSKSNVNTDWQKELRNPNAPIQNHKVSVSGGGKGSNYYLSFGYIDQQGIYAKGHSDYTRYNVRLKYNTTIMDTQKRNWLNKLTLGADESTYYPPTEIKMGDHPVVWVNENVKSKNVYFQFGHGEILYKDNNFLTMFRNAIRWALIK